MIEWLPTLTFVFSIVSAAVLASWALRSNIANTPTRLRDELEAKAAKVQEDIDHHFSELDRKIEDFRAEWLREHLKLAEKADLRNLEQRVDNLIMRLGTHIKNDN